MPIEAWKIIAPAIKEARERCLFGSWDAFGLRKRKGSVAESLMAPVLKTDIPLGIVG